MRNVAGKEVGEIKTCISCSEAFSKNSVIFEIIWKNMAETDRSQMTI